MRNVGIGDWADGWGSWSGKGRTDWGRATWIVARQLGGQIYLKRRNNLATVIGHSHLFLAKQSLI